MNTISFNEYGSVFTPGEPIFQEGFLIGRRSESKQLHRYLTRNGFHPIVTGHRGVGKTSLVKLAIKDRGRPIYITCDRHFTWSTIATTILQEIGIHTDTIEFTREIKKSVKGNVGIFNAGVGAEGEQLDVIKRSGLSASEIDPWQVFQAIKKAGKELIIVLDEYENILPSNKMVHSCVAALIKKLADNSRVCKCHLIVVGVGQSGMDLLGEHPSITRSAVELYVKQLTIGDMITFLSEAEKALGFTFALEVKKAIAENASGFPQYIHRMGLTCLDIMEERNPKARYVTKEDYDNARAKIGGEVYQNELRKVVAARLNDREKIIFRYIWSADSIGKPALMRSMYSAGILTEDESEHILKVLQFQKRLITYNPEKNTFRLVDPVMAPFLRLMSKSKSPQPRIDGTQFQLF